MLVVMTIKNNKNNDLERVEKFIHPASLALILCPVCYGSGRNPEAPAEIVDDDGTCLVCCFPLHSLYAAHHGYVWPSS